MGQVWAILVQCSDGKARMKTGLRRAVDEQQEKNSHG
jgi:hypothetical protein